MATTHEQQCQILINVAYSLQYSLKDQIKPKHLASRFYFFFFTLLCFKVFCIHTLLPQIIIYFWFLQNFFFCILFCKIGSHVWPLTDVGLFSLLHTSSFGSGEQKGGYCENSFNVHVWRNAIMDRHTGNVLSKELLWWIFTLKVLNLF